MQYNSQRIETIHLPKSHREVIIEHCQRKMSGIYLAEEQCEKKAFGLIGGTVTNKTLTVSTVIPLKKNARSEDEHRLQMDGTMKKHAIPSETPLEKRGWVADADELNEAINVFQESKCRLIGTYHMHRVPWAHDPVRDTPTKLDTQLGSGSRMFMFIISTVEPSAPIIRAFFEGDASKEVPIEIL